MARKTARAWRVGERSGPAVTLSGFAGLPEDVGHARRSTLGNARSITIWPLRPLQRIRKSGRIRLRSSNGVPHEPAAPQRGADDRRHGRRRVDVRIELCAGLAKHGVEVTLFAMGRLPDDAQRAEALR